MLLELLSLVSNLFLHKTGLACLPKRHSCLVLTLANLELDSTNDYTARLG